MAEKIAIEVELKSKLDDLTKLDTSQLKLSQKQKDALEVNRKGAETALKNNDLKEFRIYFNRMADILKKASVASGKISQNLQDLTKRQDDINKTIQELQEKRDKLEASITSSKGKNTLSRTKASELLGDFKDKDKIIGKGKDPLQDPTVINQRVQKLAEALEKAGKTWTQLTNEMAQTAGFKDKNAAHAAHRFYESEQKYITTTQGQITDIDTEIQNQQTEATSVADEIKKIEETSPQAAEALQKLYAAISKLKEETNTKITAAQSEKRKEEAQTQTGAGVSVEKLGGVDVAQQTSALGRAFKQFTVYNLVLKSVKKALREAVQTVKELDKYLTEQAMVTGMTREQTYGLVKEYQNLALQCGATTKEIAQVSTEYMKQGKSIKEALTLTEAAVSAAKVARVSVGDSVNYLTTALNGFRLSAEDAMLVSDKFAAVAAASATDYDELAIALSKVASQANLAGMSIDYTTALLTKGLETTREAPETMGTALKTIIARMREMSDYGETLEGDTDINNVESQLAYVDIALRNTNGELRSTEEVLDELGKKWDTLDKNQQAAIAKALAGTRQQSRLIAMMDDYERVTELQEIAQRSAGATAAQAGVYLEGMEASLNKIQVAWEKIVTGLTDSEVIIGILDTVANILDNIGSAFENEFVLWTTITPLIVAIVNQMTLKWEMQKKQNRAALEEEKTKRQELIISKQSALVEKKALLTKLKTLQSEKKITKEDARQALLDKDKTDDARAEAILTEITKEELVDQTKLNAEIAAMEKEIKLEENEIRDLKIEQGKTSLEQLQNTQGLFSVLGGVLSILTPIFTVMQLINIAQATFLKLKKKEPSAYAKSTKAAATEATTKSTGMFAGIVSAFSSMGVPGIIAGIALATVLVAALGVGIAAACGAFNVKKEEVSTADRINDLSTEIYKLQEKANALNEITTSFNELDDKLIKTNEDLKEMNSLLEKAADSLSDEEKEVYNSLQTEQEKIDYLERIERESRQQIYAKNNQIVDEITSMSNSGKAAFFDEDTTDPEVIKAQSAVRAVNNTQLYKQIDKMKEANELNEEEAAAVEAVTQALFDEMNAEENWQYAQDTTGQSIERLIKKIREQQIALEDGSEISAATILNSEDYTLKEQVQAFKEIEKSLQGDTVALQALRDSYQHLVTFTSMNPIVLDFIENKNLSTDQINNMYSAWKTLQKEGIDISQEVFETRFSRYLEVLAETNGDALTATREVFYDYLDGSEKTLNAFINAYGNIVEKGILNMGQSIEKTKNTINGFYEKAMEWNELSDSEKSEFISNNLELFSGKTGADLLSAFETGDYARIEEALRTNKTLQEKLKQQRDEVAQELKIEEAKQGDARNEAYIKQLKEYQSYLDNVEDLFKASLEVRLEQEQAQLDEYRSYLEDQREALEESLEKRKEAYEKYFSEIDQKQEDADYQKQSDLLISNLTKLGASQDANSQKQAKEIEQQLKELEEERLQQLRERAREALLENMDDEISQINDKFDELLENNRELLKAMTTDLENPLGFVSDLIANKVESGASSLEIESYIKSLEGTFGSVLGDQIDWDNISVREENNQMILNVNGQEIKLDAANEQNLYQIIMQALTEIGAR